MSVMMSTLTAAVMRVTQRGLVYRYSQVLSAPAICCTMQTLFSEVQHCPRTTVRSYQAFRNVHSSNTLLHFLDARDKDHEKKSKELMVQQSHIFDEVAQKDRNKKTFQAALAHYTKRHGVYHRGHVEFIYASLDRMREFGVHRDLDTYKKIVDLFPKKKLIPRTIWQVEFMHYPKQQQCCIDVLDTMEYNGVIPDDEMGYQLLEIFGDKAHVFRKYRRMMYWLPKFKYANPYYVPHQLPDDNIELAKMALRRMAVDLLNEISVFKTSELDSSIDDTHVVMAQSEEQRQLLADHPVDTPVFVEGGFITWLRYKLLIYFVLRSDTTDEYYKALERRQKMKEDDTNFNWNFLHEEDGGRDLAPMPSIHEQQDGTILGMCITGTASKDSLASWVKFLERTNPCLTRIPVVFRLRTPEAGLQVVQDRDDLKRELELKEQQS